ncbi:septin-1-like, partial [Centruroides vittatus]|uniref:septin-1-like n=1 Tax=Centruroides vittatus TaxID=120091 RepID=UPI00351032BA
LEKIGKTVSINTSTVEIDEKGVKLRLTIVDTAGYSDAIRNTDSFIPINRYIEEQFEFFLTNERTLHTRNLYDTRVHCCFYCISPFVHRLKFIDILFMKELHNKVNIIPLITKADSLTKAELTEMKHRVMKEIVENGIRIYSFPDCDSYKDEDKQLVNELKGAMPFAVSSALQTIEANGTKIRGIEYPGLVDIENPEHCDLSKLKSMLIIHMEDLRKVTHELHYKAYRADRLANRGSKLWRRSA